MIVVDVGNNCEIGIQIEKIAAEFARFRNRRPGEGNASIAEIQSVSPDEVRGIFPRVPEDLRQHCGDCGLSVTPRNADSPGIKRENFPQQLASLENQFSVVAGGAQFRIVLCNRRIIDNDFRPADVFSGMADKNLHAGFCKPPCIIGHNGIASAHPTARFQAKPCQSAHADAPDPDKVKAPVFFENP